MEKLTQKQIKGLAKIDISGMDQKEAEIKYNEYMKKIAYCSGTYGVTGYLLQGEITGTLYGFVARSSNLFSY